MKIGFVGLGNLGLPCALAIERYGGHEIFGYDISPRALEPLRTKHFGRIEPGVDELLATTNLRASSPSEIAAECDVVFVAVQTPHQPQFEGTTPLTEDRADFDYAYLRAAVAELDGGASQRSKPLIINVVSTVLPGTMQREIEPLLGPKCAVSYNPFFIAMGTTIADFMRPEFVLLGSREPEVASFMSELYASIHHRPVYRTTVEAAELIKVSYNTFIGLKLAFVGTLMETCARVGADVDQVTTALCNAEERLISAKYMKAGMGDGGGCHPRDNIAMSYMARRFGLSYDLFSAAMEAREGHTRWLAAELISLARETSLPVIVLGTAYKADSDLEVGSPARLLLRILEDSGHHADAYDPFIAAVPVFRDPAIFFIGANHTLLRDLALPSGSIVVDPWGDQPWRNGIRTIRPGRSDLPRAVPHEFSEVRVT